MIVEFSNKARMKCQFVGLSVDEFILLKVPMAPGIRDRMGEGAFLQFRYLKNGKIIGFGAEVLRYQASPSSLVFISYPKEFSEFNLRHEGRVQCRFPTQLAIGEDVFTGYILDISSNGCRFVFDGGPIPKIEGKVSVVGAFTTMEGGKKYEFKGSVTGVQKTKSDTGVGIQFEGDLELPEGVQSSLKQMEEMRELEKATQEVAD